MKYWGCGSGQQVFIVCIRCGEHKTGRWLAVQFSMHWARKYGNEEEGKMMSSVNGGARTEDVVGVAG